MTVNFRQIFPLVLEDQGSGFDMMIDSGLVGEVPRGEKMLYSGTDPESYITEYTSVYEEKRPAMGPRPEARGS